MKLRRLRAGLYGAGIQHVGCRPIRGREPGGPVLIERVGRHWEPFCPSCLQCDPNAYGTLREAAKETAGQWGAAEGAGET